MKNLSGCKACEELNIRSFPTQWVLCNSHKENLDSFNEECDALGISYTTCTFCDNLVLSRTHRFAKTPVCSPKCRKKLTYNPKSKDADGVD